MTFELDGVSKEAFDAEGRLLVLGGPGSGKTTLALLRAQRLIPGLEPGQQILFLSFSRAAVRQVLVRCKDVLSAPERERISVQTYHAFCMSVLKGHGRLFRGNPVRVMYPDREKIAKANFNGEWSTEVERLASEDSVFVFDAFAGGAARMLREFTPVAELIADRYPLIILDEFQDTSDEQWQLVQSLALRSEVMMLADPDQRIFEYDDRVDPKRLDQVREVLAPREFDLGGENHRSPDAGILQFANAVLRHAPLPTTDDVKLLAVRQNAIESTSHAAAAWLYSDLKSKGIERPSIAILARSNSLVADISTWLGRERQYNKRSILPISHDVLWDVELSAIAAQIIASILEWPEKPVASGVTDTLDLIASYFEVKSAIAREPVVGALKLRDSFRANAELVRLGKSARLAAAKHLLTAREAGPAWRGDPFSDWTTAREILNEKSLAEIVQSARFVRLFGATDEIGGRLSEQWDRLGNYGSTVDLVRRTLDQGRLISEARDPQGTVIMNVHKSKGKEFDGVLIVEGEWKGVFLNDREEAPHWASRRLLRVAITRARHRVIIVRPLGAVPLGGPED